MSVPTDVVKQAKDACTGWAKITGTPEIGPLTPVSLQADIDKVNPLLTELDDLDKQMTIIRNQRDTLYDALWDSVKRVRNAIKGIYGDDSIEYELVGGTRLSDHKPPEHHTPPAA